MRTTVYMTMHSDPAETGQAVVVVRNDSGLTRWAGVGSRESMVDEIMDTIEGDNPASVQVDHYLVSPDPARWFYSVRGLIEDRERVILTWETA